MAVRAGKAEHGANVRLSERFDNSIDSTITQFRTFAQASVSPKLHHTTTRDSQALATSHLRPTSKSSKLVDIAMHFAERILSHDGLLATNLVTAAVSIASVLALTKLISWRSSLSKPEPSANLSEPSKETEAKHHPEEPQDSMATDATTRPHRSSTLRAVIIPETSSPVSLEEPKKDSANSEFGAEDRFDVYSAYMRLLSDELLPMPVAAILVLAEVVAHSPAATMYELVEGLKDAAAVLKSKTSNPVGLTAGCDLFIRYVTTARQDFSRDFSHHKAELVRQGKEYAETAQSSRDKIAEHAFGFIKEDAVILTHSYSRVVMQALLKANKRKRISVYVTEARPKGLGMKTYNALTAAGIPCTVILDSAVAYCMDKVDLVLVGSEAVVESGGLINAVGTLSMAIIAKAANKPLYALAESYKFLRFFPLSQYDLPIDNSSLLTLPSQKPSAPRHSLPLASPMTPRAVQSQSGGIPSYFGNSSRNAVPEMSQDQIAKNPEVDYTRPDLITLVFSDVGILTPDGISSFLVGVFAD